MIRRAALAAAFLVLISATGVLAAAKTISISATSYSPASVTVAMGGKVKWTNKTGKSHTVVSDASFLATLFFKNVTVKAHTTSAAMVFPDAGTFLFHDSNANLHGSVAVPMTVDQSYISLGNSVTLTLGTAPTTTGGQPDAHYVQASRDGGAWTIIAQTGNNTTGWTPNATGTWSVRTYVSHMLSNATSGYSPILTVTVS